MRARGIALGLLVVALSLPIWAARTAAGPEERGSPLALADPRRTHAHSATSSPSVAGSVTVGAASLAARSGGRAFLPIAVCAAHGVGALQIDLVYDPAVLELDGILEGCFLKGARLESIVSAPGRVRVALAGGSPIALDGTLCVLCFDVKGATGTQSHVTIADARAWERASTREMRIDTLAGEVRVVGASGQGHPSWLPFAGAAVLFGALVSGGYSRRRHGASR